MIKTEEQIAKELLLSTRGATESLLFLIEPIAQALTLHAEQEVAKERERVKRERDEWLSKMCSCDGSTHEFGRGCI